MSNLPQVYNITKDEMENVTQEWCDKTTDAIACFGKFSELLRIVTKWGAVRDKDKIKKVVDFIYKEFGAMP